MTRLILLCLVACVLPAVVRAQEAPTSPPTGPAQIMNRAQAARSQKEMSAASAVGGANPQANPHQEGANPHAILAPPTSPTAEPDTTLPRGSIEVSVADPQGRPYGNAEIVLGIMQSMGGREERREKTDAQGSYTFRNLPVGSGQAYRVNVSSGGAKFSSNPFRLPDQGGYRVRIPLQATTRDDKMIFSLVGQTVIELRDERLHVTESMRLANAGDTVYVFPEGGLVVELPQSFTAFQWQDQMTDQKATEVKDKGFRLVGSLPPGSLQLMWSYDLERDGTSVKLPVSMPFRTYNYRVISEAPEGLKLRVNGFPEPERISDQGRDLLFTQLRKAPPEAPIGALTVRIDGIPGPGPGRWVAVVLALIAVLYGLTRALSRADDAQDRRTVLSARKASLLEAAKTLEAELKQGEVGPQFHARRMDEIQTELAMVLRDEELLGPASRELKAAR
jgi:hypothetical protein